MLRRKTPFSTEALSALINDIRLDESSGTTQSHSQHPEADDLFEYATGAAGSQADEYIQQHISGCRECASRIEAFKRAAQAWEGVDGEARLEKIRTRLRKPQQREMLFTVSNNGDSGPNLDTAKNCGAEREFERSASDQLIGKALHEAGAIESECDYVLPNGLHAGVHVNLGRVCRSENSMAPIVRVLDGILRREKFDTVVSTSWALAAIARRLVLRLTDGQSRRIQHISVEGYDPPSILDELPSDARVILLVDVVVTGSQIARVTDELKRQKANSVKTFAIVDGQFAGKRASGPVQALCRIPVDAVPASDCIRCNRLPRAEFNPVAGHMTKKNFQPRSPSEFLEQDPTARQFWEYVDIAGAFEHHRIIGRRHYIGFIDTARLLRHRVTGKAIVRTFCQQIVERSGVPDAVLVPARTKSLFLGRCLLEGFERYHAKSGVRLATVRQHLGHFTTRGLPLLSGQRVLIADAAAGRGDTLDELVLISSSVASSVAGAVLLSRLSEACEQAFDQRLSAGFTKLYSMPVRPITVRDKARLHCSVCLRRQDLKNAVGELPPGTVKTLAEKLIAATPKFRRQREKPVSEKRQIALFARNPLETHRPSVTSGIALHALHAAMGDGMAPLSLPEIASADISVARRAALVADLPSNVLKWSGPPLVKELCQFLKRGVDKEVWIAIVELMSRSGSMAWIDSLKEAIGNAQKTQDWMDERFWARMILIVHRLVRSTPEISEQLQEPLESLIKTYEREDVPAGLEAMLDTAYQWSREHEPR